MYFINNTIKKIFGFLILSVYLYFNTTSAYSQYNFWLEPNRLYNYNVLCFYCNSGNKIYAGTEKNGIFCSEDNGDNWNKISYGFMDFPIKAISFQKKTNSLFVGTWGGGIFCSMDSEHTWIRMNNGLESMFINAICNRANGSIFIGTDSVGIFFSEDIGDDWIKINKGLTNFKIQSFHINKKNEIFCGTFAGGVYRWNDQEKRWNTIGLVETLDDTPYYDAFGFAYKIGDKLFYIARRGIDHTDTLGHIRLWESIDFGKSWNSRLIYDSVWDDRNLAGGVTTSGDIIAFFMRRNSTFSNLTNSKSLSNNEYIDVNYLAPENVIDVRVLKSIDGGKNWILGEAINDSIGKLLSAYGPLVELPSGRIMQTFYSTDTTHSAIIEWRRVSVMFSDNNGDSWINPSTVYSSPTEIPTEASAIFIDGDHDSTSRILLVTRTRDKLKQFISEDGGKNWIYSGEIPNTYGKGKEVSPWLLKIDEDNIVLCWADRKTFSIKTIVANANEVFMNVNKWEGSEVVYNSNYKAYPNLKGGLGYPSLINIDSVEISDPLIIFYDSDTCIQSSGYVDTDLKIINLFSGKSSISDLLYHINSDIYVGTNGAGIYKWTSHQKKWINFNSGLNDLNISSIVSNFCGDIFAGTRQSGVFSFDKNEKMWIVVDKNNEPYNINTLVLNLDGYLFAGINENGLYRSKNSTLLPGIPLLESPLNKTLNVSIDPRLNWSLSKNATFYHLQISLDSLFSSVVIDTIIVSTTFNANLNYNRKYFWRIRTKNDFGNSDWSNVWSFSTIQISYINEIGDRIPKFFQLHQNYPNPFKELSNIYFELPKPGLVSVIVYDINGREVKDLVNGYYHIGIHTVTWFANSVPNGIYFICFKSNEITRTIKTLLFK